MDKETSDLQNVTPDDTLPPIKVGLRRLAKIYYWPAEIGDNSDFNAFCEFVIFNVGIKKPFFEKLLDSLLNRMGDLYQIIFNGLSDDTPQITYEEAYVLFRKLKIGKTRDLLNKFSCSSNMFNGILKSIKTLDYDLFLSSLHESDNKKMMQVLWEMRYILYGIDHYVTIIDPTGQIKSINRWLDGSSYYNQFFYLYTQHMEMMYSEDERETRFVENRLKEIVGISVRRTRCGVGTLDLRIDRQYVLVGNYFPSWLDGLKEIDNVNEFIKSLKSDMGWITSRAESVAKSILTRNVISHSKEIADEFNYDYSALDEETMNSLDPIDEEDMEILRNYILLYTNEMLYIYNKVENILDDDSKKILKSILYSSKYTELLDTTVKYSKADCLIKESGEDYDRIIKQWKSFHSNGEYLTFQPICKLSDSEIDMLLDSLRNKNYISGRTTNGNSRDIFKEKTNKQCKEFEPLVWEKRNSKNNKSSKVSVINFLWLLGVNDDDITVDRLNYCFVCPDGDTFVPFKSNNLKNKKGERCRISEYNDELRTIIESALKDNNIVKERLKKLAQSENE